MKVYVPENLCTELVENKYMDLNIDDIETVDNGTFIFNHDLMKTGIYDENGDLCKSSVLLRYTDADAENVNINIKKCDFINETVIYLGTGYVFEHFGHFLIEGINRFWPLLYPKYKNTKVVIALDKKTDIKPFVRKMLNAMGVSNKNIIVINKNTKFSCVLIPRQSSIIDLKILPITKSVYDKIAENIKDKNIKVFDMFPCTANVETVAILERV